MTTEHSNQTLQDPTLYTANGEFPNSRVVAVDFMGAQFDIRPSQLTDRESNAFCLGMLGYTSMQAAGLSHSTYEATATLRRESRLKMAPNQSGLEPAITNGFANGTLVTTRAVVFAAPLSERESFIWNCIPDGFSAQEMAKLRGTEPGAGKPITVPVIKLTTSQLLSRLGLANKAAAALYNQLTPDLRTSYEAADTPNPEGRIKKVGYKGGLVSVNTERTLNAVENNYLVMKATGLDEPVVVNELMKLGMRADPYTGMFFSKVGDQILRKYHVKTMAGAWHKACKNGQVELQRECIAPEVPLSPELLVVWGLVSQGSSDIQIGNIIGVKPDEAKLLCDHLRHTLNEPFPISLSLRRYMTYPISQMLPPGNTYSLRRKSGITLPNPRFYKA